ncbi:winged helix-turn-helix domain-containing protein [Kaistia algarum]|nr:winged helix-turn-helix domain-containing protein [Kaistia algarum]
MDVSVSELARIKGVSQPAISKRLKRFVESGLITTRTEDGRTMVNLAAWDSVTQEATDPAKIVARETVARVRGRRSTEPDDVSEPGSKDPTYTQELTRKAGYDADLKEIEIGRLQGRLRDVVDIQTSAAKVGELMVRDLEQLPSFADDLAGALAAGGVQALREELKRRVRAIREGMARNLANLAAGATGDDPEEKAN